MHEKKISIIIPCYNVAPYIDRCLASIAKQTIGMDSLEIICIDDASGDDTWEHLRIWERRFPAQVMLIRLAVNGRQGAARNIGLSYASADWIAFVDGDDWLEPDYFEKLYEPAVRLDCEVVSCSLERDCAEELVFFKEGSRESEADQYIVADTEQKTQLMIVRKLLGGGPCAKIIRKSLLTEHGIFFPEGLTYEDLYWAPLLHVYVKKAYIVGQKLYHYYQNQNSTMCSRNQDYHMDWITIQMMKWTDYDRRGILQRYREELECDALCDAAGFLNVLVLRYDLPSYSWFRLEQEWISQHVPDYRENRYIAHFNELFCLYLETLYAPVNRAEFQEAVRRAGEWLRGAA